MSIKSKIQALITAANTKTGETDETLTDAVQTLVDGYGQGADPVINPLSVTENGTYTAPDGVDGYSPVSVNVVGRGLPSEYQEVKFLHGTGEQRIDTGVYLKDTLKFEGEYSSLQTTEGGLWGVYSSQYGTLEHQIYKTYSNAETRLYYGASSTNMVKISGTTTFNNYHVLIDGSNVYVNDELLSSTITRASNSAFTIPLYNVATGAGTFFGGSNAKFRYFKIWDGNELVRDFVPCYRKSDNVAGMYDLVTNQLFTNQGTGNFIVGADVG